MQVFQTWGVPPSLGSSIRAIIGWTRKSSVALTKSVRAKKKDKATFLPGGPALGERVCRLRLSAGAKPQAANVFFRGLSNRRSGQLVQPPLPRGGRALARRRPRVRRLVRGVVPAAGPVGPAVALALGQLQLQAL